MNETRPNCTRKPTKAEIVAAVCRHTDIDPLDDEYPFIEERVRLTELADVLAADPGAAPTFVIDSGNGIQCLWVTAREPNSDAVTERVEAENKAIDGVLGGDTTFNIDRLLRLPGTLNFPTQTKLAKGRQIARARVLYRADRVYTAAEAAALGAQIEHLVRGTGLVRTKGAPAGTAAPAAGDDIIKLIGELQAAGADGITDVSGLPPVLQMQLNAALLANRALAERWAGKIDDLLNDKSRFDFSVAALAKLVGFSQVDAGLILCGCVHAKTNTDPWRPAARLRHVARCVLRSIEPASLVLRPEAPLESAIVFLEQHRVNSLPALHHVQGTFYGWQGTHYAEVAKEEMRAQLYAFLHKARRVTEKGANVPFDPSKFKVANVLEAVAAEAQLPSTTRPPTWLDTTLLPPEELIICTNGLLHFPKRALLAHTPAFFSLNALPFDYSPAAPEPAAWLTFLGQLWPEDRDTINTLQEIFGLLLTGDTRHQKAFLLVGPKRSGKGTIARIQVRRQSLCQLFALRQIYADSRRHRQRDAISASTRCDQCVNAMRSVRQRDAISASTRCASKKRTIEVTMS